VGQQSKVWRPANATKEQKDGEEERSKKDVDEWEFLPWNLLGVF
jgi:hypothetical protein